MVQTQLDTVSGATKIAESITRRSRVLLIWFELPNRPELLEPFSVLSNQFEFIHLIFNTSSERQQSHSPFQMIYWFDYASPFSLLKSIRPDVILSEFPSDLKCIALAVAAKRIGVPYLGITHGIYFAHSFDIVVPNENSLGKLNDYSKYLRILRFYLSVVNVRDWKSSTSLLKFLYYFVRIGFFSALKKVKFEARWPLRYIVYQMKNSDKIMYDTHRFPADRLIPIGVPQFDKMFTYWNSVPEKKESEKFYLMIDTAWVQNASIPPDEVIYGTYRKLAAYCKQQGAKLLVKLHPHWYTHSALPQEDNIEYVRNVSQDKLSDLMIQAQGCFLYFSTLSIPIVPYINCYFLYHGEPTDDLLGILKLGVAKAIDIQRIELDAIDFSTGFDKTNIETYIDDYLYAIDGKSTKRLGAILQEFSKTSPYCAQA